MTIEQFKTDEVVLSNINQDSIPRQVVMQGEKDGRSLTVQVTNGGVVEPQAGLNLNLGWKHRTAVDKDGKLIQGLDAFEPIDRENGIFRIEYASSMAQPGTIDAEIQFVTGTSVTKSQPFIITVKQSTVDESAVESESSFTVLQEALAHVSQYDEKIEGLEISKAEKDDLKQAQQGINVIEGNKIDKNGNEQVSWANLSQEAKRNISGEKVAVVGDNSVTTTTIANNAVTIDKTDFIIQSENLFDKNSNRNVKSDTKGYYTRDGKTFSSSELNFAISHPIYLEEGTTVSALFPTGYGKELHIGRITGFAEAPQFYIYDGFISGTNENNDNQEGIGEWKINKNGFYVFNYRKDRQDATMIVNSSRENYPVEYIPLSKSLDESITIKATSITGEIHIGEKPINWFIGGDSISDKKCISF